MSAPSPLATLPLGKFRFSLSSFSSQRTFISMILGRGIVSLSSRKVRIHSAHVGLEQSLLKDPAHVTWVAQVELK